jgi:thiamine pyrophosphate-dependent acetolactate synthase large subunit-like protein
MNRLEATRLLVAAIDAEPIVASLGHPAYDLFAAGDRPANFYTWGSMGLASSIGLGLALSQPELRVFVVDGDGSLLMNLGSLATIGWTRPANLVLIVWDNQLYGTTGGQDTATAHGANLEAAARAMGAAATATAATAEAFETAIQRSRVEPGPWVIVAKVAESAPTVKPPLDCVFIKQRFMAAIGQPEDATRGAVVPSEPALSPVEGRKRVKG